MTNWPPKQPMHTLTVDVAALAAMCHDNSVRWFPSNHTTERAAVTHCTLGLAGEAGETANKVKKLYGYMDQRNEVPANAVTDIVEELVDTLIYDLVLLHMLCPDIPAAIRSKIAVCEERWGNTLPPPIPELADPMVTVRLCCGHELTCRWSTKWESPRWCPQCSDRVLSHGFDNHLQTDEVKLWIAANPGLT